MAKKVLILMVVSIILVTISVKCSEQPKESEQPRELEKDYQEGIKLISQGKYSEAATKLVYAFAADYKHSIVLYYYAAAAQNEVGSRWYEYYREKLPFDYDGPFSDQILALKRGDPEALIAREENRNGRFKETFPTPKSAPLPPPPGMPSAGQNVKDDKGGLRIDPKYEYEKTFEEREKEYLQKAKENIGRRFIARRVTSLNAEFYDSPSLAARKFIVKDTEPFSIVEVIQITTVEFYKVKFDSGKIAYLPLMQFGFLTIGEKSIVPISDEVTSIEKSSQKMMGSSRESKNPTYKAVELVKNHPTLLAPDTGKMRSVEKRMIDARESFFPNMTWRYEVIVIEKNKYRVTQHVDNGKGETFDRTWIVNVSTNEVSPENLAAKKLYY